MKSFIKLAIRNVKRNLHLTLLNGVGLTLSVIVLLLIFSLSRGIEEQIVSRSIKFETGALALNFDKTTMSHKNEFGDTLLKKVISVLKSNPEIGDYSYRICPKKSLLYLENNTQSIHLIGIQEKELPILSNQLKILSGEATFGKKSKGILISNGIADAYHLKIKDECNIMLQTVDGSINLNNFSITGIFRYTSQMNKENVYMNYNEAKSLYNTNLPSRILLNIKDLQQTELLKINLFNQLKHKECPSSKPYQCDGYTISSYTDQVGMAKTLSKFNRYGMLSIATFLILISFIGFWSMQLENIHSRSKEIGTLLSLGFSRLSVKSIFLYESILISLFYFIIGAVIALILIVGINLHEGIYLGDNASFAFGSSIVNPLLNENDLFLTFIMIICYPLLATLISLHTLNKKKIIQLLKRN